MPPRFAGRGAPAVATWPLRGRAAVIAVATRASPACAIAGGSGLAGHSGGISAWSCLAALSCPAVTGLVLLAGGPVAAVCVGVWGGAGGAGGAGGRCICWMGGCRGGGALCGSRGGSVEAAEVAMGDGEVVGGVGVWGCGSVVGRPVGTAGAASGGKSSGVSWSPPGDQPVSCWRRGWQGITVPVRCDPEHTAGCR